MNATATTTNRSLRIVADYQLMSDAEGRAWMTDVLNAASDKGLIENFEVLGAYQGKWGLQHVAFTVDVALSAVHEGNPPRFHDGQSWDEAKEAATDLLNGAVVPDSDVVVRWVSPNL